MKNRILTFALATLFLTGTLPAQVPALINYQGRVAVDGVNFDSATAGVPGKFRFALVSVFAIGTAVSWGNSEDADADGQPDTAVELPVSKGLYSVLLGDDSLPNMLPLPGDSIFADSDVRLRVWFDDGLNGSQLLTPDQRLAPAAYLADGSVRNATMTDGAVAGRNIAAAAIDGTHVAGGSLDFSHLSVPAVPGAGQVLGFDGNGFSWVSGGGGDSVFSLNPATNDVFYNGGNVGIGTSVPANRLTVQTIGSSYGLEHTNGPVRLSTFTGGDAITAGWLGTISDHPLSFFVNNQSSSMTIATTGFVGIGTTAPQDKLHVYDPSLSVSHRIETGGVDNAWSRVEFANSTGQWNVGTVFNSGQFFIHRQGLPIAFAIDGSGLAARFTTHDLFLGHPSRRPSPGRALVDLGTSLVVNFDNDWGTTIIGGLVTQVRTLRITGGADLAEPFEMKEEELEKGSVVVIDDEHPGRLKRSTGAYDTRVAGIISGANGVNPGIALHQEGLVEGGQNVALSGRVYVQADASSGAIKPGDLLTTSDTPGHAMKVTERVRAQGAVIGKAMSSLNEGTGMVLVLVTLQ